MADAAAPPAKPQKGGKKDKKTASKDDASGPLELNPPPSFLQDRVDLFDRLKAKQDEEIAKKPREPIRITMPDGSVKEGTSWQTTPGEIARAISNSLYKRTVVARLDGDNEKLWDLDRPLEASCKLELLDFNDPIGKMVFWHSSAHVLGEACERRFGCSLCIGVGSTLVLGDTIKPLINGACSPQLTTDSTTRWPSPKEVPSKTRIGNPSRQS